MVAIYIPNGQGTMHEILVTAPVRSKSSYFPALVDENASTNFYLSRRLIIVNLPWQM